jgi:1-acyl-sn-glycerol-3-phosphate acyltransferase
MKSKLAIAVLMLILPVLANADRYGHHGHRGNYGNHRGGNSWIAPAIIGGAIVGSAIYGATRDDEPVVVEREYRRPMSQHEIREAQLRQREYELEQREREYYERQRRYNDDDNCREYYRNERGTSYYSKNCW